MIKWRSLQQSYVQKCLSYNIVKVITDIISVDIKALILQASIHECLEMWRDLDTKACKGLHVRTKLIY